jgi:hypothetical protein
MGMDSFIYECVNDRTPRKEKDIDLQFSMLKLDKYKFKPNFPPQWCSKKQGISGQKNREIPQ